MPYMEHTSVYGITTAGPHRIPGRTNFGAFNREVCRWRGGRFEGEKSCAEVFFEVVFVGGIYNMKVLWYFTIPYLT